MVVWVKSAVAVKVPEARFSFGQKPLKTPQGPCRIEVRLCCGVECCPHRSQHFTTTSHVCMPLAFRSSLLGEPVSLIDRSIMPFLVSLPHTLYRRSHLCTCLYFLPSTMMMWYPSLVLTSPSFGAPVVLGSRSYATFSKSSIRLPRTFQPNEPPRYVVSTFFRYMA